MKAPKALYLFGKKPIDNKTVYLKSEADRYIAHQKMKRCEAMARWCEAKVYNIRRKPLCDMDDHEGWQHDDEFWQRWHKRWLKLAEKFKVCPMCGRKLTEEKK